MFMMHETPATQEDRDADGDNNKDMECNIRHNSRLPLQRFVELPRLPQVPIKDNRRNSNSKRNRLRAVERPVVDSVVVPAVGVSQVTVVDWLGR